MSQTKEELFSKFNTSLEKGLDSAQVKACQNKYGPMKFRSKKPILF